MSTVIIDIRGEICLISRIRPEGLIATPPPPLLPSPPYSTPPPIPLYPTSLPTHYPSTSSHTPPPVAGNQELPAWIANWKVVFAKTPSRCLLDEELKILYISIFAFLCYVFFFLTELPLSCVLTAFRLKIILHYFWTSRVLASSSVTKAEYVIRLFVS